MSDNPDMLKEGRLRMEEVVIGKMMKVSSLPQRSNFRDLSTS
jgi:hypothetical protein